MVNRDLSVSALSVYSKLKQPQTPQSDGSGYSISVLEALAATGLRSIRYRNEVDNIGRIVVNDVEEVSSGNC